MIGARPGLLSSAGPQLFEAGDTAAFRARHPAAHRDADHLEVDTIRYPGARSIAGTLRGMAAAGSLLAAILAPAAAGASPNKTPPVSTLSGTLYYTRFVTQDYPCANFCNTSPVNVRQVSFTYTPTAGLVLGTSADVAQVAAADGIAAGPGGELVVGGQYTGDLFLVDPTTGATTSVAAGTPTAYMVGLSPDGNTAYLGGVGNPAAPGVIGVVSLNPLQTRAPITVHGPDAVVDSIAFVNGQAYYTSGLPDSNGDFGMIDLTTGQETQLLADVPFAHGMVFDPFSGTLILTGGHEIAQVAPATGAVVGAPLTMDLGPGYFDVFDLPWVDGQGHLFAAANDGNLVFVDYSGTQSVASAQDVVQTVTVDSYLDDTVGFLSPAACAPRDPDQNGDTHSNNHNGLGEDNGHANNDSLGNGLCGDPDSNGDLHSNNHNGQGEDNNGGT